MIFPVIWLRIKIRKNRGRNFGLWLPLFLFWPLGLALAIILLPLVLLITVLQLLSGSRPLIILLLPRLYTVACALRGMKVDMQSSDETVYVVFK